MIPPAPGGERAVSTAPGAEVTPRPPLIFLAHRIPYPPNKGDKIRSYHLLEYLARHYAVHLGAFVDDPDDWAHAEHLRATCASLHLESLPTWSARLRAGLGLLGREALTLAWYRSAGMRRWVGATARRTGARRLVCFSSAMAQYADAAGGDSRRILDMVDVDSDKWRQYAARRTGAAAWLYRREADRLLAWECTAARSFDATTLVSAAEVDLFEHLCPDAAGRVSAVANGVDTDHFRPEQAGANPYPGGGPVIAFTGAMDYWPNVDAACWFADAVLPRIREHEPRAAFHVVGARPAEAVRALAGRDGVHVAGGVPDMRPWIGHADLVVAPLRVARGIQNKVLEGFAMARPVLATSAALDGLDAGEDYPLRADTAADLAALALATLAGRRAADIGARMRAHVCAGYGWDARLARLLELLEPATVECAPETARGRSAAAGGATP